MAADASRFEPPRRLGVAAHLLLFAGLGTASLTLFVQATRAALGPAFLAALLASLALALPLPLIAYRLVSLLRSSYRVERDGIRLQWGARAEDIPIDQVLWVEHAADLVKPLALPAPRWPGALVGERRHPDAGAVEFMAARSTGLVLIGTRDRTYAISPTDPDAFVAAYQRALERGSLRPLRAWSARPSFLLVELWQIRAARAFLTAVALLNLALFVWVALAVPELEGVSLGYLPSGNLQNPVPGVQLFVLPVVCLLISLAGVALATALHRRQPDHPLAFVVWGSLTISNLLFMGTVYVILQNS